MATAILGMQWGDEGKGKITHLLAREADMVVRYNGGPNAGHTVIDRGEKFGIHLLPMGCFYRDARCVLASGMVIDIPVLREEYGLIANHLKWEPEIVIAENAHVILPYHRLLEELEGGGVRIGTTRRGIGPAYRDKVARVGIRAGDLLHPVRLRKKLAQKISMLKRAWPDSPEISSLSTDLLAKDLLASAEPFLGSIKNAIPIIAQALNRGENVLFEGAQGALLDLDFGTYPFVTSSSTTFMGLGNAIGIPFPRIDCRVGVMKAYTTRVGRGPFPTRITDKLGNFLQQAGNEFGVTTGRPRDCGWLDLVALKHAVALNDPTTLAITKLDVLSGLDEIKMCGAYQLEGRETNTFSGSAEQLALCEPIYESISGWKEDIGGVTDYESLPRAARAYIERISKELQAPIGIVSTGPSPEETINISFDRY